MKNNKEGLNLGVKVPTQDSAVKFMLKVMEIKKMLKKKNFLG